MAAEMVTVAVFPSPVEAQAAKNRLGAKRVMAHLTTDGADAGHVNLQVAAADANRATLHLARRWRKRLYMGTGLAGDDLAKQAALLATTGIVFWPGYMHIISVLLLLKLRRRGLPLSKVGRRQARSAWFINLFMLLGPILVITGILLIMRL